MVGHTDVREGVCAIADERLQEAVGGGQAGAASQ